MRRTQQGNFALYRGKLNAGATTHDYPVGYSYLACLWDDRNNDRRLTPDEVLLDEGVQYYNAIDPENRTALVSPNTIDPDYKAPSDYEVVVGLDREVFPDFAIGASYTWRRANDLREYYERIGMTSADYTANAPTTSNGYTARTFTPDPDKVAASGGGSILKNRPDYHQGYNGIELLFVPVLKPGQVPLIVDFNAPSAIFHERHFPAPEKEFAPQSAQRTQRLKSTQTKSAGRPYPLRPAPYTLPPIRNHFFRAALTCS